MAWYLSTFCWTYVFSRGCRARPSPAIELQNGTRVTARATIIATVAAVLLAQTSRLIWTGPDLTAEDLTVAQ